MSEPCKNQLGGWHGHVDKAAEALCARATATGERWGMDFNGVELIADPNSTPRAVVAVWSAEMDRKRAEYVASPEYAQRQKEAAARDAAKKVAFDAAIAIAPPSMSFADEAGWRAGLAKNTDPYGGAVYVYAEQWARIMEGRIARGETVEQCADDSSHVADTDGITGFMYGAAVGILAHCWKYGEALRRWHNLKTQIRDEGVKANASGGVLNPAILSLGGGS